MKENGPVKIPPYLKAFLIDAGERVARAFIGGLVAGFVAGATNVLSITAWETAAIGGLTAAVAMVLSILAQFKPATISPASFVRRRKAKQLAKRPTGRRKPDPVKVARGILDFTPFLKIGAVIPATVNYLKNIDWSATMYGNDAAGDCEAARVANWLILISTFLGTTPLRLTQAQVWAIYKTQNPGFIPGNGPHGYGSNDDGGMDTQTLLEFLSKHGFDAAGNLVPTSATVPPLVVAFGTVDPKNLAAVEAAVATFGGVWYDIIVLDGNQQQFSEGQPWTNDHSAVDGGHAVLGGGFITQRIFVTWANIAEFAESFWSGTSADGPLLESVWVVVHPDHLGSKSFLAGVEGAALASEFTSLTGKPFPVVAPTPTPAPTPVPPAPVDDTVVVDKPSLVAKIGELAAKNHESPHDYLEAKLDKTWK